MVVLDGDFSITYSHRYQREMLLQSSAADVQIVKRTFGNCSCALLTSVEVVVQDVQGGIDPNEEVLMSQYIVRATKAEVSLHVR